jgi:hypothetical protein
VARYAFTVWNFHPLHLTGFAGALRHLLLFNSDLTNTATLPWFKLFFLRLGL